ncbi:hypothetical protein [Streptomyces parvulus]|uniref:hypothetical protein n=1 Tax=Streptomyces parvulus TaxID=146923 RepID=UPI0037B1B665
MTGTARSRPGDVRRRPRSGSDYGRIVNDVHFHRLTGLMGVGELRTGGDYFDRSPRPWAPAW